VKLAYRTTCLAIPLLSLAHAIRAQERDRPLTLERAQAVAADSNPSLVSARHAIPAAQGVARQLGALADPEITWEWEAEDGISFGLQRFGMSQFLEFPGKRQLRGAIGADQVQIERDRSAALEHFVRAAVAQPFYQVAAEDAALDGLATLDSLFARLLDITRTRFAAGEAAYNDVLRIEIERIRLQREIIAARRRRTEQAIALNLVLGRPDDAPVVLASSALQYVPLPGTRADIMARRLADSRTLNAAQLLTTQRARQLSLARKTNLPDFAFDVGVQHVRGPSGGTFSAGGVAVSIPLWRASQQGAVEEASAELDAAGANYRDIEARVAADVATAYEETAALAAEVQLLTSRLLPLTDEALNAGLQAYGLGQVQILDVIDLLRTVREARLEYVTVLADYLASRARLVLAGELVQE